MGDRTIVRLEYRESDLERDTRGCLGMLFLSMLENVKGHGSEDLLLSVTILVLRKATGDDLSGVLDRGYLCCVIGRDLG